MIRARFRVQSVTETEDTAGRVATLYQIPNPGEAPTHAMGIPWGELTFHVANPAHAEYLRPGREFVATLERADD